MTDHYTDELFAPHAAAQCGVAFVNGLSRLVFDPERACDGASGLVARVTSPVFPARCTPDLDGLP
jgi:N-formylglutamate amidohydrolase